jgi:hypothetical protein
MMAFSHQDLQRKLRTYGAVGLIVAAAGSFVVVEQALGGGGGGASVALYNVTFMINNGTGEGASGNAAFRSTATVQIPISQVNLTMVTFSMTYQDNSVSPLFNPAVNVAVQGPEGAGGATGSVSPGQPLVMPVAVNNEVPLNGTVEATSPEEAVGKATGDVENATIGVGDWTVTIDVGAPLAGRIRPSGSITYTINVETKYFAGNAERV